MNRAALNALDQVVSLARSRAKSRVPIVGVAGPQGSGKTTLVSAFAASHPKVAHFSLDDVYLSKTERQALARDRHPLFVTRGPPGTHAMALFDGTVTALEGSGMNAQTPIPVFDKASDDRLPQSRWPVFEGRPSLILVDGWCLGATPQSEKDIAAPINKLEMEEDSEGAWRRAINQFLEGYQSSFAMFDAILCLRAPLFNIVLDWRCQQEEGLLGYSLSAVERDRIARFIAHYERLTLSMMAGRRRADIEIQLDRQRNVVEIRRLSA